MRFKKKKVPFYTAGQEVFLPDTDKFRYLDMTTRYQIKKASGRMMFLTIFFVGLFCILGIRLFQLTVLNFHGHDFENVADFSKNLISRHNIFDRNGNLLATNMRTYDLSVNPALVKGDMNEISKNIAHALKGVRQSDVLEALTNTSGFAYIKRKMSPVEYDAINHLGYYFLTSLPVEKRIYPQGRLVSHLLGGVDIDNFGISGIEKAYDNQLGTQDVQLSLDISVQEMVYNALSEGIKKYKADGGLALVMDVNNGEVMASVSLPDYDPNLGGKMGPERFNQVSLGTYEFGSIFKLFNTALGLESKSITLASSFDASQPFKLPGRGSRAITDYRGQARTLTVPEILILSSNIGSAQVGLKIGAEKQREFFRQFGFYEKMPIALPERGVPQGIFTKSRWNETESSRLSYGYGLAITPLHLVAGVATLVNGGVYRTPTFIKGGNQERPVVQLVSEKTSQIMRHLMWAVVAYELPVQSPLQVYVVGGKTGSKQILKKGKYVEGRLRTSFVGVFPMNQPKYIVLVSLNDPKKIPETFMFNTAGWNAKQIGLQIIGEIAPYLGVKPVSAWEQPDYITRALDKCRTWKKEHR